MDQGPQTVDTEFVEQQNLWNNNRFSGDRNALTVAWFNPSKVNRAQVLSLFWVQQYSDAKVLTFN